MHPSTTMTDDFLADIESLPESAIALTSDQLDRAFELSDRVIDARKQWQAYISAIALMGFEQWIQQRTVNAVMDQSRCTITQLQTESTAAAVCNLIVNGFRICLLAIEGNQDEIEIPKAVIEQPDLLAHFYVAIAVYEEQAQIIPRGFIRRDRLVTERLSSLTPETYLMPIHEVDLEIDRLLLFLSFPQQVELSLPIVNAKPLVPLHQLLTQPLINVGHWLEEQWGQVATELQWIILPPAEFSANFRSSSFLRGLEPLSVPNSSVQQAQFDLASILLSLERDGMRISPDIVCGYRDFNVGEIPLRLYAAQAPILSEQSLPEWSLLLILKPQADPPLLEGMRLIVSDLTEVLVNQAFEAETGGDFLFTRVIGTQDEKFTVTVGLPSGATTTIASFSFQ